MKALQYAAICLYYYGRAAGKNPAYIILFFYMVFITHKLATWVAWAGKI